MTLPRVSLFQSAMRMRLTYGVLPTYEAFKDAFEGDLGDSEYVITNCRDIGGNGSFSCDGLWALLNVKLSMWQEGGPDNHAETIAAANAAGDFVSAVLQTLGIEWV